METHHSHHITHKKKWSEYILEFFMLFLAVFLGFIAENIRENIVEQHREKQYMKSLVEDLASDTVELDQRISTCVQTANIADSLIILLTSPERVNAASIYFFFRTIHRSNVFTLNDRTIVQLRNAGGMLMVSNKAVSDSIVSYYKEIDLVKFLYDEQLQYRRSLRSDFPKILNGIDYGKFADIQNKVVRPSEPVKLLPADFEAINTCILTLQNLKGINQGMKPRLERLKRKAEIIREFIVKEYHLQ